MYNGGYLIAQISKMTDRRINEILKKENIKGFNSAQARLMMAFYYEEELSIKDVCELTGLAKTTLTSMLNRMEKQGLVKKYPSKEDRRVTKVKLTPKARDLEKYYAVISRNMKKQYYKGFTKQEIKDFEDTLRKILKNLTETD